MIFDMTPCARDIAEWRARQAQHEYLGPPGDVNTLEATKGCASMDSGATVVCSSTPAAEGVHTQRARQHEPGVRSVRDYERCFRVDDGMTG